MSAVFIVIQLILVEFIAIRLIAIWLKFDWSLVKYYLIESVTEFLFLGELPKRV